MALCDKSSGKVHFLYCCVLVPHHVPTPERGMAVRASRSRPTTRPEPEPEPERFGVTIVWALWLVKALDYYYNNRLILPSCWMLCSWKYSIL